jgi:SAM-dependent methyltransferase
MKLCPVCQSEAISGFLHRGNVPVHQNLVIPSAAAAREIALGDLTLTVCHSCGFVFNSSFDQAKLSYGESYDNTQCCSPYFDGYLDELVRYLVEEKGIQEESVVEVGCGKGDFLRKLVTYPGSRNRGIGFDPSYVGPDRDCGNSLEFHRRYYGPDCTGVSAGAVICRHVIEHVPEPFTLLKSVREALASSPGARVFFETPCVQWILENQVIWDFFYEHCSLFSAGSITTVFERAGFAVEAVHHVFGGQYLWVEATIADWPQPVRLQPMNFTALGRSYAEAEKANLARWHSRLMELNEEGPVSLWGGGAKGATFANLIDPGCELIDSVVDLNPNKQGKYLPGTGHPIIGYRSLPERGVRNIVLMNPNYRCENEALLATLDAGTKLHEWSSL